MFQKKESAMLRTRIAERKNLDIQGFYKILDRDRFFARSYLGAKSPMVIIDISTTGCALKVDRFIPKGSYVEIELKQLTKDKILDPPIIAACETVYCRYINRTSNKIGAKFLEIKHEDVDRIRQYTE